MFTLDSTCSIIASLFMSASFSQWDRAVKTCQNNQNINFQIRQLHLILIMTGQNVLLGHNCNKGIADSEFREMRVKVVRREKPK